MLKMVVSSIFRLEVLLNTDNVSEMQKLAIFIKRALMIHKNCLFNITKLFLLHKVS